MPGMSKEKVSEAETSFTLRNAGSGFEGRSSGIFGQLDVLERQHVSHEQSRTDLEEFANLTGEENEFDEGNRSQTKRKNDAAGSGSDFNASGEAAQNSDADKRSDGLLGGKRPSRREAQFRRPSGRPPGRHRGRGRYSRIPDHRNKPQNWTYYSLEDVQGSDMSEKSNTQAALAFLDERRKLRENQDMDTKEEEAFDVASAACSKGLFSFAKRNKTEKSGNTHSNEKLDKDLPSLIDNADEPDEEKTSVSAVKSAASDIGTDVEQTLDEEGSSTAKDDTIQTGFKSRKRGVRRNIRARDDDD
ncbi:uncharacterized protein LOC143300956 [Babylonia areolata]|uniref:uncharacterized protein LOC143300956 n=1 Tax=Babylonia areolata TaxID=304850 RepID=UPI003FD6AF89